MATRGVRARLEHIAEAIAKVDRFLAGKSFADFRGDALVHDAVVRNLEIISEASRHITEDLKRASSEIPWKDIANFGNLLRHGYEGVNDIILWDTIQRDLPPLLATIRAFLARPELP